MRTHRGVIGPCESTYCLDGGICSYNRLSYAYCTWSSEEMRAIIYNSEIWQLRRTEPLHPRIIYGLCLHGDLSEFMCHVYTFEDYIVRKCISYDEQMAFVTNLLNALCQETKCTPICFEASFNRVSRVFCISHTLGLGILDRLLGLDQGHYEMYWCGHVHQADVGPAPLHPNSTHGHAYRHPFVYVNCDRRMRYREDLLSRFQAKCYPLMAQHRRLKGLRP